MKTAVVRAFGLFASVVVAGGAAAQSGQAVEWKVSEGGNGHWYARVPIPAPENFDANRRKAVALGGDLASITSAAENQIVFSVAQPVAWQAGVLIGTRTPSDCSTFFWSDGEPWGFTAWGGGQPDCGVGQGVGFYPDGWHDLFDWHVVAMVVEFSSDCNADGIVDYGQIQSGQLSDDNANGIPDICETSITGVIPPSVPAQGGSAISINGRNFPAQPTVLVGGVPATNVVRVSETRLTANTPALLPGMASVSVNDFTLADGIYIRPECGSDLDQDGEVTASDIAIVLLDFGPCYATATSSQSADSTPFLLKEEAVSGTAAPR
jgi:hypothetical protein